MRIRNVVFGLFAALAITLISSGTAFAGPAYIFVDYSPVASDCVSAMILSQDNYNKYRCENSNFSLITGPPGESCTVSGENWTSGFFSQTWHHKITMENNPSGKCMLSKLNENTWKLTVKKPW